MICCNQVMIRDALAFLADEPPVLVDWLPWNHTAGGNHNFGIAIHNGGTLYIDDGAPTPASIAKTVRNLEEIAPTLYFSSPRAWSSMLTRIQVGIAESTRFKRRLYEFFIPFAVEMERARLEGKTPTFTQKIRHRLGSILIYGPIKDQLGLSRVERPYTAGEAIGELLHLLLQQVTGHRFHDESDLLRLASGDRVTGQRQSLRPLRASIARSWARR